MSLPRIAAIIPQFNGFAFSKQAVRTFFEHTPGDHVAIVLDDASPKWDEQNWDKWFEGLPASQSELIRFETNKGLTRSWNHGLIRARDSGAEYAICGNSDIIFTPGWYEGLLANFDRFQLLGPVTNASGFTNRGRQQVQRFMPTYKVSDRPNYLADTAAYLRYNYPLSRVEPININGFFLMASLKTWWDGAFNEKCVFNPGKKMTGNEDELQRRWFARGWKAGFVPASFIFHYRSISRDSRHMSPGAFRPT